MTGTNGTPIHLAPASGPNVGIPPCRYVLMVHTQVCDCCHKSQTHSEVYAETHLKSRLEAGKYITNLRPVQWPSRAFDALYDLPITRRDTKPTSVPFCHLCHEPSLSHWPKVPQPVENVIPLHTPQRVPDRAPAKATEGSSAKEAKPKGRSLDSILDML